MSLPRILLFLATALTPLATLGAADALLFTANGEEHAREGTQSRDGWTITFQHVYVTLDAATAYQTNPPYDTGQGWSFTHQEKVRFPGTHTVDLAEAAADPATVGQVTPVPPGHYNALSWTLIPAAAGPAQGSALFLAGQAVKDDRTVDFTLKLDRAVDYLCGEYVGDERKGWVAAGGQAEVEATFHLDHLFGRADQPADDPLNQAALGFDSLAALAENGKVEADLATLAARLTAADYAKLEAILLHLGHVGEGHCLARFPESRS